MVPSLLSPFSLFKPHPLAQRPVELSPSQLTPTPRRVFFPIFLFFRSFLSKLFAIFVWPLSVFFGPFDSSPFFCPSPSTSRWVWFFGFSPTGPLSVRIFPLFFFNHRGIFLDPSPPQLGFAFHAEAFSRSPPFFDFMRFVPGFFAISVCPFFVRCPPFSRSFFLRAAPFIPPLLFIQIRRSPRPSSIEVVPLFLFSFTCCVLINKLGVAVPSILIPPWLVGIDRRPLSFSRGAAESPPFFLLAPRT